MNINKNLLFVVKKITSFDADLNKSLRIIYQYSRYDWILHYINLRLCQLFYKATNLFITKKNHKKYDFFRNSNLTTTLSEISNYMLENIEYEKEERKKRKSFSNYVKYTNYAFVTFNSNQQQLFFDHLPKQLLEKLSISIERSGILKEASSITNTNFKISQLRTWLLFPDSTSKDLGVHRHADGLPPGTLKIMFYKGSFDEEKPALTLYLDNSPEVKVNGVDPILIFDSNAIEHSAPFPSKIRPTIEISLTPSIKNSYKVIQAGFMAGCKYNPFIKSKSNISMMVSK